MGLLAQNINRPKSERCGPRALFSPTRIQVNVTISNKDSKETLRCHVDRALTLTLVQFSVRDQVQKTPVKKARCRVG
ncbi:unnamed protein product [Sphenostylis stenocarpa]|uniref:Uncharacterized protein n=1 Tax=Sphenostylis stenocarpa TaxID=92480 RepID=A0AA86VG01_9FABA|nr:unnamed protein product [Sphenostylis stenocarpa]